MPPVHPVSLTAEGLSLRIAWSDGHASIYPPAYLRLRCPCAHCVDEATGVRRIRPEEIPPDIHPLRADPVGRYAILGASHRFRRLPQISQIQSHPKEDIFRSYRHPMAAGNETPPAAWNTRHD